MGKLGKPLDRHDDSTPRDNVRKRQHSRAAGNRLGERFDQMVRIVCRGRNRNLLQHDSVPLCALAPATDSARVLTISQDHLVTGLQVQAVRKEVHPEGGILGERDISACSVHKLPQLLSQRQLG